MNRFAKAFVTAAAVGLLSTAAHAASVGTSIYNTADANGMDLSGVNLGVEVTDTGSLYQFVFTNHSSIASSITQVYFIDDLASVLAGDPIIGNSTGVDFRVGTVIKKAPHPDSLNWDASLTYLRSMSLLGNGNADVASGINNGGVEQLTVSFAKVGGSVLGDVIDILTNTGGIVLRLVDLNGAGLDVRTDLTTHVTTEPTGDPVAVPTPASAAAGIALLGLLAARRRKLA